MVAPAPRRRSWRIFHAVVAVPLVNLGAPQGATLGHAGDAAAEQFRNVTEEAWRLKRLVEAQRSELESLRQRVSPGEPQVVEAPVKRAPADEGPRLKVLRARAHQRANHSRPLSADQPLKAAPRELQVAPQTVDPFGSLCKDIRGDDGSVWVDESNGFWCDWYVSRKLCTRSGKTGPGWVPTWGTFADFAGTPVTADKQCCGCGGGTKCQDTPGWADTRGFKCADYVRWSWCAGTGKPGANWTWGADFAGFASGNVSADKACCACKVHPRDAGGDRCDYYGKNPDHCGCCDTPAFVAAQHCPQYCPEMDPLDGRTLAERIRSWPTKTTAIVFPKRKFVGPIEAGDWPTRFPSLKTLLLPDNQLQGTVPLHLGSLRNLEYLVLSGNLITGTLPAELVNASGLYQLDISKNKVSGSLPTAWAGMQNLGMMLLSGNQLTGTIPPEYGMLTGLFVLNLAKNQLTGTVPLQLGDLPNLAYLILNNNQLSGTIPPTLGNMAGLGYLWLSENMLSGSIPKELGNIPWLTQVLLFRNQLSGTLPDELQNLNGSLQVLQLFENQLQGTLPSWIGAMPRLSSLLLQHNRFEGTLPPELWTASSLWDLELNHNFFTGTLPPGISGLALPVLAILDLNGNLFQGQLPDELGQLLKLQTLDVSDNQFAGTVPPSIGHLPALEFLKLSGNPKLSGAFPNTSGAAGLREIWAGGCNFTSAGPIGPNVQVLSFPGNKLTALPNDWVQLPSVQTLDLSGNAISTWRMSGVLPLGSFVQVGEVAGFSLGIVPLATRVVWPGMQAIDLSGNPLGPGTPTATRDLLASVAYLPLLGTLKLASCGLAGEVPYEFQGFMPTLESAGDLSGKGSSQVRDGFTMLRVLDLSNNSIKALRGPPPPALVDARLTNNALVALDSAWFQTPNLLRVSGNPLLRVPVQAPRDACPAAGTTELRANPHSWASRPTDLYECTVLCPGSLTRYTVDSLLNADALCRCKPGMQGSGMSCSACPPNTYSYFAAKDVWAMNRTCQPCPARASTDGDQATDPSDCKCDVGFYMGVNTTTVTDANGTSTVVGDGVMLCQRCKQWPFRTTLGPGRTSPDQCVCNPAYNNQLRAVADLCGCPDGTYLDHVAEMCKPCSSAEDCNWGAQVDRSVAPPLVLRSFWAEPAEAPAEDGTSNFTGNNIWNCVSKDTCLGNSVCTEGRAGRACSVCQPGTYGGQDGKCWPCTRDPGQSQGMLVLMMVILMPVFLLAHVLLYMGAEQGKNSSALLKTALTGVKLMIKHVQMMSIVGSYSASWPPAAKQVLGTIGGITGQLPSLSGAACLSGRQTATGEMLFRWLTPVVAFLLICLVALILYPVRKLVKRMQRSKRWTMGAWDVLRLTLWGAVLFYATLVQYSVQVLTCTPSPNKRWTSASFPHLECAAGSQEWGSLVAGSVIFLLVFLVGLFAAIFMAWQSAIHALVHSEFREKGWWGFLFDDFRAGCTYYLMLMMFKDAFLVFISVLGAGDGPTQLIVTAVTSVAYAYHTLAASPFRDPTNSQVETWAALSVALVCLVGAAMGYSHTPGIAEITTLYPQGSDDPKYKMRATVMLLVLVSTLLGTVVLVMYRLMLKLKMVKEHLPKALLPVDNEDLKNWNNLFLQELDLKDAPMFERLLQRLDAVDNLKFRNLMGTSTASLGIVHTTGGGFAGFVRHRMSMEAQRDEQVMHNLRSGGMLDGESSKPEPTDEPGHKTKGELQAILDGCDIQEGAAREAADPFSAVQAAPAGEPAAEALAKAAAEPEPAAGEDGAGAKGAALAAAGAGGGGHLERARRAAEALDGGAREEEEEGAKSAQAAGAAEDARTRPVEQATNGAGAAGVPQEEGAGMRPKASAARPKKPAVKPKDKEGGMSKDGSASGKVVRASAGAGTDAGSKALKEASQKKPKEEKKGKEGGGP